jgi:hypothetical protein
VNGLLGPARRLVIPEILGDAVDADGTVSVEREAAQQGTLGRPSNHDRLAGGHGLERPEDPISRRSNPSVMHPVLPTRHQ